MTDEPEIIDVEPAEERTAQLVPTQGASAALFGTTDPVEVLVAARRAAEALVQVLEERQLYKQISNKKHVYIEGWLMLAGMLQVSTPNTWVREIIEAGERVGWEARYEARAADGRLLSSAEGECRRMEEDRKRNGEIVRKWEHRAEHAIRSMAQTRAQSKALASALRWVVELGGFSGTPAEEMSDDGEPAAPALKCPACGQHTVRDNRAAKKADPDGKEKWPAFGCRNDDCHGGSGGRSWATWDSHYYEQKAPTPEVAAKQQALAVVAAHPEGWAAYFEEDAPGYTDDERAILSTLHQGGDDREKAGFLWNRLVAAAQRTGTIATVEDITPREYAILGRAAEIAIAQAADDHEDIILEEDALAQADAETGDLDSPGEPEEEDDPSVGY
jgi:hypothetical protein